MHPLARKLVIVSLLFSFCFQYTLSQCPPGAALVEVYSATNTPTDPFNDGTRSTITGCGFGDNETAISASINLLDCSDLILYSDSLLTCFPAPGVGTELGVTVTVDTFTSTLKSLFSYNSPSATQVIPVTGTPTEGGYITILGSNFGPPDYTDYRQPIMNGDFELGTLADWGVVSACPTCNPLRGPRIATADEVIDANGDTLAPEDGLYYVKIGDNPYTLAEDSNPGEPAEIAGYSMIYQDIFIPLTASGPALSFYYYTLTQEPIPQNGIYSFDYVDVVILDPNNPDASPLAVILRTLENDVSWINKVAILDALPGVNPSQILGQTIRIAFRVFENPDTLLTWMYLDDIVLTVSSTPSRTITITLHDVVDPDTSLQTTVGLECTNAVYNHTYASCLAPVGAGAFNPIDIVIENQDAGGNLWMSYGIPVITQINNGDPVPTNPDELTAFSISGANFGDTTLTNYTVQIGGNGVPYQTCFACEIPSPGHSLIICYDCPPGAGLEDVIVTVIGQSNAPFEYDYQAPIIYYYTPEPLAAIGGDLTIIGDDFGALGTPVTASINSVLCDFCNVTQDHDTISCIGCPAGVGFTYPLVVTVAGQDSSSMPMTYSAPSVTGYFPTSDNLLPLTEGNSLISILGDNFGPPGPSATVTVGGNLCTNPNVINDNVLVCDMPAGSGVNNKIVVSIGDQIGSFFGISYHLPIIDSINDGGLPSTLGGYFTIQGDSFGPNSANVSMTVNSVICNLGCIHTEPHVEILCNGCPGGFGAGNILVVTVDGESSNPFSFSFTKPIIQMVNGNAPPAAIGGILTFTGVFFGPLGTTSINATINGEMCSGPCDTDIDQTEIVCDNCPPGVGTNNKAQITVGGQTSAQFTFSYAAPAVTDIDPGVVDTTGGVVTITGYNFGPAGTVAEVTIGGVDCTNPSDPSVSGTVNVDSDNQIVCFVADGAGENLDVYVTVGGQTSTFPDGVVTFSYTAPNVTRINDGVTPPLGNVGIFTVFGTNFGPASTESPDPDVSATLDGSPCTSCVVAQDFNEAICWGCPGGAGTEADIVITIHSQESNPFYFAFAGPVVTGYVPVDETPTEGDTPFTVLGYNFGPAGTSPVQVFIDNEACTTSIVIDDSIIVCLSAPPGSGENNTIHVIVLDQVSNLFGNFSYASPIILGINSGKIVPTSGGIFSIFGTNFGQEGDEVAVTVRGNECTGCSVINSSLIYCEDCPGGTGGPATNNLQVTVQELESAPFGFAYTAPIVTSFISDVDPINTEGGVIITVKGENFGDKIIHADIDMLTTVYIGPYRPGTGRSICVNPDVIDDHTIVCEVPAGTGDENAIMVLTDGQNSNPIGFFGLNYTAPSITSVNNGTRNYPTTGGLITLYGDNFGPRGFATVTAEFDDDSSQVCSCSIDLTNQHHEAICSACPQGTGVHTVKIEVDSQWSSSISFTYAAPVITGTYPDDLTTSGGDSLTILGYNFGQFETSSAEVFISLHSQNSWAECTDASIKSPYEVVCTSPVGVGNNNDIYIIVDGSSSDTFTGVQYEAPSVTDYAPHQSASTAGGSEITISGDDFGPEGTSVLVQIGKTQNTLSECENAFVVDHHTIYCDAPAGTGVGNIIQVTVPYTGDSSVDQTNGDSDFTNFKYALPIVSFIDTSSSHPAAIGGTFTIDGSNFGASFSAYLDSDISDACSSCIANSDTVAVCVGCPAGVGAHTLTVSVDTQANASPFSFTYAAPVVTAVNVTTTLISTTEFAVATIYGYNFGPFSTSSSITVAPLGTTDLTTFHCTRPDGSMTSSVLVSGDNQVVCIMPFGNGINNQLDITIGGQTATFSNVAYPLPTITSYAAVGQLRTIGGDSVNIYGTFFGRSGYSDVEVYIGQPSDPSDVTSAPACTGLSVLSPTQLQCNIPSGVGTTLPIWIVSGDQQALSPFDYFAYDDPYVFSTTNGPVNTQGGTPITINGENFGPEGTPVAVTINGANCTDAIVISDTKIVCNAPGGSGAGQQLVVTVNNQANNYNQDYLFSYGDPTIVEVTDSTGSDTPSTLGGTWTISGSNFGKESSTISAETLSDPVSQSPITYPCGDCSLYIPPEGEEIITCFDCPSGVGVSYLRVIVDSLDSSAFPFTYASPVVTGLRYQTGSSIPTEGGVVTILGTQFGPVGQTVTAQIGSSNCENHQATTSLTVAVDSFDDYYVVCYVSPGTGANLNTQVRVGGQTSPNFDKFDYSAPIISSITPLNDTSIPGFQVSIHGDGFGPTGTTVSVLIGGASCTSPNVIAHTDIICTAPSGFGTQNLVQVFVTGQNNSFQPTPVYFSYSKPIITQVDDDNVVPAEDGPLTIYGKNFGPVTVDTDIEVVVKIIENDPQDCQDCNVVLSATIGQIVCDLCGANVGLNNVTVSIGGQASDAFTFSRDLPVVFSVDPASSTPTTGGLITVNGKNFGTNTESITVTVDGDDCTEIQVLGGGTGLVCSVSAGVGVNQEVIVVSGGLSSPVCPQTSCFNSFSYGAPVISSISSVPTQSGAVTFEGFNFGPSNTSVVVSLNSEWCSVCSVTTAHTEITCNQCPSGTGVANFAAFVGGQRSAVFATHYDAPVISSISPNATAQTTGGDSATISGNNFGAADFPTTASILGDVYTSTNSYYPSWTPSGTVLPSLSDVSVALIGSQTITQSYTSVLSRVIVVPHNTDDSILTGTAQTTGTGQNATFSFTITDYSSDSVLDTVFSISTYETKNINYNLGNFAGKTIVLVFTVSNQNGAGPNYMFVDGLSIATTLLTSPLRFISVDSISCQTSLFLSDTEAVCVVPVWSGANVDLVITVDGQVSEPSGFWYASPVINSVDPVENPLSTSGGSTITINGYNFGPSEAHIQDIKLTGLTCDDAVMTVAHTQITCTVPEGAGSSNPLIVFTGPESETSQPSNANSSLSYAQPTVSNYGPVQALSTKEGSTVISINGTNFGPSDLNTNGWTGSRTVLIDSVGCTVISANDTTILCSSPAGSGNQATLVVDINGLTASDDQTFGFPNPVVYHAPHFHPIRASNTAGGDWFTITGKNFGPVGTPVTVIVGGIFVSPYAYVLEPGHTEVAAIIPAGTGLNNLVTVLVGFPHSKRWTNQLSSNNSELYLDYPKPIIEFIDPNLDIPTLGGVVITVYGKNFGPVDVGTRPRGITIEDVPCNPIQFNQTWLTCLAPAGVGAHRQVVAYIDYQLSEFGFRNFEYAKPSVLTVIPDVALFSGLTITLLGSNFGEENPTAPRTVLINNHPCTKIVMIDDGTLTCRVGKGSGASQSVFLTVMEQTSLGSYTVDFADPVTPGLSCVPPTGAQDRYQPHMCNCWSGYAPTDENWRDCNVRAVCPGQNLDITNSFGRNMPSHPESTFDSDHLYIQQTIPIVHTRRNVNIRFASPSVKDQKDGWFAVRESGVFGSPTCSYPGYIWTKTVNELDCADQFSAVMPWTMNELCGFQFSELESTPYIATYQAQLVTTFQEIFLDGEDTIQRVLASSYLVSVSFKRKDVISIASFAAVIPDPYKVDLIEVSIVGDTIYDPKTRKVFVSFETSVEWPYMLASQALTPVWTSSSIPPETRTLTASAILRQPQPTDILCTQTPESTCTQQWITSIDVFPDEDSNCIANIQGTFAFEDGILCRDVSGAPTACVDTQAPFHIIVGKTDLCDPTTGLDASQGTTFTLTPYSQSDLQLPQAVFETGDTVFFSFVVTDPLGSIDSITFNRITLVNEDSSDLLFNSGTTSEGTSVNFQVLKEVNPTNPVPPGTPAALSFSFKILRGVLTTVADLSTQNAVKTLSTAVTVDVYYHGNQKETRSIHAAPDTQTYTASDAANINVLFSPKDTSSNQKSGIEGNENVENIESEQSLINNVDMFGSSGFTTSVSFTVLVSLLVLMVCFM